MGARTMLGSLVKRPSARKTTEGWKKRGEMDEQVLWEMAERSMTENVGAPLNPACFDPWAFRPIYKLPNIMKLYGLATQALCSTDVAQKN